MKRRDFLAFLGGTAAWPLVARAQQPTGMRRIGVLLYLNEQDVESKTYLAAFVKQLSELGWRAGGNLQIDYRWTGGNVARLRQYAAELVALSPDVILAAGGSHVGPLQQLTRTIPIVFVQVATRSAAALWRAWRTRAAMSPGSATSNSTSAANGWSCCGRSHPHSPHRRHPRSEQSPHATVPAAIQARARARHRCDRRLACATPRRSRRHRRVRGRSNAGLVIMPTGLAIVSRTAS